MSHTLFISVIVTTYNRPDAPAAVAEACFSQNEKTVDTIVAAKGIPTGGGAPP